MNRPADYDKVQEYGTFTPLPAGGYVCRIMSVEETTAKTSGAPMIKISLDIVEGEYKDYYATMYRNDTRNDKKWNAGAVVNQLVYDTNGNNSTNRGFKTFCTSVEESNPGFNIQWGDKFAACFKNKLIGVLFRREEYMGTDGKTHWSTKANSFRSAQTIREGKFDLIPDKPLDGTQKTMLYGQPAGAGQPAAASAPQTPPDLSDFEEILVPESDLPF